MNIFPEPVLACGVPMVFVYAFYATAALVVGSFIWGAVSLFSGAIKVGLGLISFSACLAFAFLKFFGFI